MIEFGKKIKRLREEKGMTQQTMAEQLYVTRQAVSRWECGARYPDLLMAKKIAALLETTIDELVSEEEIRRDLQKESVFITSKSNFIQLLLFLICVAYFFLLTVSSAYVNYPRMLTGIDRQHYLIIYDVSLLCCSINLAAMMTGTVYTIKKELSPKKTGILMSVPFAMDAISSLPILYISVLGGANHPKVIWLYVLIPIFAVMIINLFFSKKGNFSPIPIYVLAFLTLLLTLYQLVRLTRTMHAYEELQTGFTTLILSAVGEITFAILLFYQAHTLYQKRKTV